MSTIESREEAMAQIMDGLRFIEQSTKARRDCWPIPIAHDRSGLAARHITIKEWILKIQEEVLELTNELLGIAGMDEEISKTEGVDKRRKKLALEEACDVIETIFSLLNQLEFTHDEILEGIKETNWKLRKRGCIEK